MAAMAEPQRIIRRMLTTDLLEFHAFCLTNTGTRLQQYAAALNRVIKPGDTVLDLGAGLGVLSILACRAGARRVHAVESSAAWALGKDVVRAAGLADRVTWAHGSSFDLQFDERVDVIVADVHAPFGLQESGLSALIDARERLLKPGGTVIPGELQLLVAPVEAHEPYQRRVRVWEQRVLDLDLSQVRAAAANRPYPARFTEHHLLAPLTPVGPPVPLDRVTERRIGGSAAVTAARAGTLHGVCVCFISTLAPGVTLRNAPGDSATTNFAHTFLPIESPVEVAAGDALEIQADVLDGMEMRWRVTVTSAVSGRRHRVEQSTLFAWPLSSGELQRDRDDYCPRLTTRGRLEQELLGRFDGSTPATALRAWVEAHAGPELPSPRSRAMLLKEAIARCG
jgi:type I protein arginine methyltransferase